MEKEGSNPSSVPEMALSLTSSENGVEVSHFLSHFIYMISIRCCLNFLSSNSGAGFPEVRFPGSWWSTVVNQVVLDNMETLKEKAMK